MEGDVATELSQRLNGPFSLRLILQPCMALLFAIRDGRKDAASGASPYLRTLVSQPGERRETLASAWTSLSKVLTIAFVLDCTFQYATSGNISVLEAVLMAFLLCAIPYTLMRGPAARFFSNR